MAGGGNDFEVVSVHDSWGKWSTYGLKMEPLKELATNLVDLAVACEYITAVSEGTFINHRHLIERLGQGLPPGF